MPRRAKVKVRVGTIPRSYDSIGGKTLTFSDATSKRNYLFGILTSRNDGKFIKYPKSLSFRRKD